jgi:hypothetical protein
VDHEKCAALQRDLEKQSEPQLVPIDRFFDGNDDEGSIGCNLEPHPGVRLFKETLLGLTRRPDVLAVHATIAEVDPGEDAWPFTDTVLVVGTLDSESLEAAVSELEPDEVGPADTDAIGVASHVPSNASAFVIWWD